MKGGIKLVGRGIRRGMHRVMYPDYEMEFATYRSTQLYPKPTLLQRLGIEKIRIDSHLLQFQQLFCYTETSEESTISPLDLSIKSRQSSLTPPCTPSPKIVTPSTDTIESPIKKVKISPLSKKSKVTRKLNFDEDTSSPVSGTIIRELRPDEHLVVRKGDIDPAFNVVEVTEEAKAELSKIENHIGDYVCRLCKELYEDAFGLAQHRCSRIVHVEYRCPECDKVFNCPANLASHRRWHKPRPNKENKREDLEIEDSECAEQFSCIECGKRFRRVAYLRKHQVVHQTD